MSTDSATPGARLRTSWDDNAAAWTVAVRDGHIPSRRAGTDAAIVAACMHYTPRRILDVGCGEGWLARTLAAPGRDVLGVDGSAALIDAANALPAPPDAALRFDVAGYDRLVADDRVAHGPWELVVCNFALFEEDLAPLLRAVTQRLDAHGTLLIQTLHPWAAVGDARYVSGWREETFTGFAVAFPTAMPWYFRTLGSWTTVLHDAGLQLRLIDEPLHPDTGRPLSLLLHCTRA